MKILNSGVFSDETKSSTEANDIVVTEVEYKVEAIDWHYHQNAFFSFIQRGQITEGNKKGKNIYGAGTVLFQQAGVPHYNPHLKNRPAALYIEIKPTWTKRLDIDIDGLPGLSEITNPDIKILFHQLNLGSKVDTQTSLLSIEESLIHILVGDTDKSFNNYSSAPKWIDELDEILRLGFAQKINLESLSRQVDVHPVHLCKYFRKYFGCTLSEYVRKIRIEKSLSLFLDNSISITEMAYLCGFSDQSHFIRNFKQIIGITPLYYKKKLEA
jgi:AraC family transcriptional regulator